MVTALDGEPIPMGRLLAQSVPEHSNFENGEAFLKNGGQKGPQIDVLLPGTYRINLNLFQIQIAPAAVVEANKIGLVTALDGIPLPEREYVASPITGHKTTRTVPPSSPKAGSGGHSSMSFAPAPTTSTPSGSASPSTTWPWWSGARWGSSSPTWVTTRRRR